THQKQTLSGAASNTGVGDGWSYGMKNAPIDRRGNGKSSPSDRLAQESEKLGPDADADSIRFYKEVAPLVNEIGRAMCVALDQGHAVVMIVTETTRDIMEEQLSTRGIDVADAKRRGQYVCLDAIETLPRVV